MLIKNGANLKATNNDGQTPLHLAAKNGNKSIVEMLINKGVSLETKDKYGYTPLQYAVQAFQEAQNAAKNYVVQNYVNQKGCDLRSTIKVLIRAIIQKHPFTKIPSYINNDNDIKKIWYKYSAEKKNQIYLDTNLGTVWGGFLGSSVGLVLFAFKNHVSKLTNNDNISRIILPLAAFTVIIFIGALIGALVGYLKELSPPSTELNNSNIEQNNNKDISYLFPSSNL